MINIKYLVSFILPVFFLTFTSCDKSTSKVTVKENQEKSSIELKDKTTPQNPCTTADINLTDARYLKYSKLITNPFGNNYKQPSIKINKFMSIDNWSTVYVSSNVADPAWFIFNDSSGKSVFKDIWAGLADENDRQSIIKWTHELGAPFTFSNCFASIVIEDTKKPTTEEPLYINDSDNRYKAPLIKLQKAIKENNKEAVANMISYPLKTEALPLKKIFTPEEFIKNYENIITPQVYNAIVNQKYDNSFINQNGFMFNNGEVWMSEVCTDKNCKNMKVYITAIQNIENL